MAKTKIQWADYTYNPVWGCKSNCYYCYAKKIAKRFAEPMIRRENEFNNVDPEIAEIYFDEKIETVSNFKPFLFNHQLFKTLPKKPSRIFIGSMSDIAFWENEWIELLIDEIKGYPQHIFLLLTKVPTIYEKLDEIMPYNVWFGVTVTKTIELEKMIDLLHALKDPTKRKIFTSFEPLTEYIPTKTLFGAGLTDWVIIGAMTGRNEPRTKTEWIGAIVQKAKEYNTPVFVKQIEIDNKIVKDFNKFPESCKYRQFPKFRKEYKNGG